MNQISLMEEEWTKTVFEHANNLLPYEDLETTEFNGRRQYLTPEGNTYPSVTTVLSILSEDSIAKWKLRVGEEEANKVSTRASRRGTAVHEVCEKYLDNDPAYRAGYMPNVIENFMTIKGVLDARIGKVYAQEVPLYSDHLCLAGRVDCIAEFDGKISVIDFKTSAKTKRKSYIKNYFAQEAAYAIMWEERTGMPITQLVTIIAVDNLYGSGPGHQVYIEKRDDHTKLLTETIDEYSKRN